MIIMLMIIIIIIMEQNKKLKIDIIFGTRISGVPVDEVN
jgi:hypothetical protein